MLNPLREVGAICREVDALFYVDFVASGGGVPVEVDSCAIDLGLLGSQKVLSLMPGSLDDRGERPCLGCGRGGWLRGLRAPLTPWRTGLADKYLPYTHNWQAMAGLAWPFRCFRTKGVETVYRGHAKVAAYCRQRLAGHGLAYFPGERGHFVADGDGGLRAGLAGRGRRWTPRCASAAWP